MKLHSNQFGFTIIEVGIVFPILLLASLAIFNFMIRMYQDTIVGSADVSLQLEAQNVLNAMEDDLLFAAGFGDSISSDDLNLISDSNEPSGGWTANTSPNGTIIVIEHSLTANRNNPAADFVRREQFGCTVALESNPRVYNNLIYYVDGSTLYKRVLPVGDPDSLCNNTYRIQTGPGTDVELTDNVASFIVTYYDEDSQLIDLATGGEASDADRIQMEINLEDTVNNQLLTAQAKVTVRNLF